MAVEHCLRKRKEAEKKRKKKRAASAFPFIYSHFHRTSSASSPSPLPQGSEPGLPTHAKDGGKENEEKTEKTSNVM
jgi:hypothetical protein